MRFRPQRGGFMQSISEMVTVHSMDELKAVLEEGANPQRFVSFHPYGFDTREPWNAPTYLVMIRYDDSPKGVEYVAGMSDSNTFEKEKTDGKD